MSPDPLRGHNPSTRTLRARIAPCEMMGGCYGLRHSYFVREKRWVVDDPTEPDWEQDRYDAEALHLAVWDGEEVVA